MTSAMTKTSARNPASKTRSQRIPPEVDIDRLPFRQPTDWDCSAKGGGMHWNVRPHGEINRFLACSRNGLRTLCFEEGKDLTQRARRKGKEARRRETQEGGASPALT